MTNLEASNLARILSGCKVHTVSSDLFMPIIEMITKLNEIDKASLEMKKSVIDKLEMDVDAMGNVSTNDSEKATLFNKSIKEIHDKEVAIDLVVLNSDEFKKLAEENKDLIAGDLAFLHSFLCK